MTTTFPIRTFYPLAHSLKNSVPIQDLGDGHEQRISKNQTYARANGLGGISSYKGQNMFGINIRNLQHTNGSTSATANILWAFYQARNGPYEAFYFYNPAENAGDPGSSPLSLGIDVTGRYLVRFQDQVMGRDLFRRFLYNASLTLIEVRG